MTATLSSFTSLIATAERQLFPKEAREAMPALYSQEHNPDPQVVLKFFCPWNKWTWYLYEGSPVDQDGMMIEPDAPANRQSEAVDYLFFGLVDGDEAELGYVSLSEIVSVKGPMGLHIERDEFWKSKPLSEVQK